MWPIVGWSSDRLCIHGTSRFSYMPLSAVCRPVSSTERDEVHMVAGHWWLVKVTPFCCRRSWPGSDSPVGRWSAKRSWSVKTNRMLGPLFVAWVAGAGVCARADPINGLSSDAPTAVAPALRKRRRPRDAAALTCLAMMSSLGRGPTHSPHGGYKRDRKSVLVFFNRL